MRLAPLLMRQSAFFTFFLLLAVLFVVGASPVQGGDAYTNQSGQLNLPGLPGLDVYPADSASTATPLLRILYTANAGGRLYPCPT